jgi:adenylate kinase
MDTEIKNDRAAWLQGPSAQCSMGPAEPRTSWRLILLGTPGVGKGTQAELLSHHLGACHLSTGDVFRAAAKHGDCGQSPAMKAAQEYMRRGQLVPDSTVWEMIRERSDCILNCGGFILDGFPRTIGQAASLKDLMEKRHLSLSGVLNYELPVDEIVSRLSGRRTCDRCKSVFHVSGRPPKIEGVCDHCGGGLYQREDDQPASITVRLDAYERSTAPLIQFYKSLGLLIPIVATGSPENIFARTIAALSANQPSHPHHPPA